MLSLAYDNMKVFYKEDYDSDKCPWAVVKFKYSNGICGLFMSLAVNRGYIVMSLNEINVHVKVELCSKIRG